MQINDRINQQLGSRLAHLREQRDLSRNKLASFLAGVNCNLIEAYECAAAQMPASHLYQFAAFFGISLDEFIQDGSAASICSHQLVTAIQSLEAGQKLALLNLIATLCSDVPVLDSMH